MTTAVSARGIVKSYHVGETTLTILREVDLAVAAGEMVAIDKWAKGSALW